MKAGISFINVSYRDVNWFLTAGCPVVQLWHGTPMMENDLKYLHEDYAFVTVASEEFLGPQLLGDPERFDFRLTGYPRSDSLFSTDESPCMTSLRRCYGFKRMVLYVPTHRHPPRPDGSKHTPDTFDLFKPYGFDAHALQGLMRKHDALFVMKLHPLQNFSDTAVGDLFRQSSNLHIVDHDDPLTDVFDYLRGTDILITDYSSLYFDFLLLDRPVVFTPFDLEEMTRKRRFRFDYQAITPGPKAMDWRQVLAALDSILSGRDDYSSQRKEVGSRFNYHLDGKSAARVSREARTYLERT